MTGNEPVVLVTGAADAWVPPLCNACTARAGGLRIHYRASQPEAAALADQMNAIMAQSRH